MTLRWHPSPGATLPTMKGASMTIYREEAAVFPPVTYLAEDRPWRQVAGPGVIGHKKRHGLQRSWRMRGPDVSGESREHQGALALQANDVFKRLGGRWMIQTEGQRGLVPTLP